MPLPLVKPKVVKAGLTARVSALLGGGEGSSTQFCDPGHSLLSFPLPLDPPPPSNTSERRSTPSAVPFPDAPHFRIILGLENAILPGPMEVTVGNRKVEPDG